MARAKLLVGNFFFFGVLRIVSSIIPFTMLPIITKYLQDPKDFGIYDNYVIAVSILCSLSMLGSYDAMFREYFNIDGDHHKKNVVKSGFLMVLCAGTVLSVLSLGFRDLLASLFFGDNALAKIFTFVAITIPIQTMNNIAVSPSRMNNNKKHILVHTLLYSISFYTLSLVCLELGFSYLALIYAHILANLLCCIVFFILNGSYFFEGRYSREICSSLLKIGLPLVPIFIIYWANNAMARIFIVNGIGDKELGVFALASRYAAVSSLLQAAFSGGWSFFTYSTMKDSDQVSMKSMIFKYLTIIIPIFCICISLVHQEFFDFFFALEYRSSGNILLFLFVAPLLLMLYQIVANQFTIVGKSYMNLIALISGLIINVYVCYSGAFVYGDLKVTSISIGLGYLVSVIVIMLLGRKNRVFEFDSTVVANVTILIVFYFLVYKDVLYVKVWSLLLMLFLIILNMDMIRLSISKFKSIVVRS